MGTIFLYLSSLVLLGSGPANQPLNIGDEQQNEYILGVDQMSLYVDSTNTLSFKEIQRKNEFRAPRGFGLHDFDTGATYWVRLELNLPEKRKKQWLLEFYDQTIDYVDVYSPTSSGTYQRIQMGDMYAFEHKTFLHKNFEVMIDPQLSGEVTFYFRIRSHSFADIRVAVRTLNRFIFYALNEYYLYGIFYGMVLIISLYNLLIFSAIGEKKYLYYTFYILSVAVYAMCVDGIAYQYLWPHMPQWNQIAYGTALYALIFWAMLFAQKFLNTRHRAPELHQLINSILVVRTLWFVYALGVDHSLFELRHLELIPLSIVFYASWSVWLKGYKPARFFVMAYGLLFTGFIFKALLYFDIIPFSIISYYSLHIGFMLEMLFLTFALSDRVRILKANRDRATQRILLQHQRNEELKDKVNRELEERIKQRTHELEEKNEQLEKTNQKLYEQTKEIGRINSMLDLDNWKLKNNIREVLQDRLINKNLTLEQFNRLFPDDNACLRFLERMKWGNGFRCLKCDNTKYSEGHTKTNRRCTKCGYEESITSNTIFHHIRFPLQKAFYILYLHNNGYHKRYTLDEMAELLDMRRNTVWAFKKKIEKARDSENSKKTAEKMQKLFFIHEN